MNQQVNKEKEYMNRYIEEVPTSVEILLEARLFIILISHF